MRLWIASIVALVFAGSSAAAEPYRLIDLTGEFTALYDRTEGQPLDVRIKAFKTDLAPSFPLFYGRQRFPNRTQAQYDARIGRAIEEFAGIRSGYTAKAENFRNLLDSAYASFTRTFPDMGDFGDIYLVHSLGEMDGGTREFEGRTYFIFGADVMGRVHTFDNEQAFFHHELFHIYHARSFPGCEAVWCNLWTEGMAVYVARELNPEATDEQLLLTIPEHLPTAVNAHLQEAVCEVRGRLDSRDQTDYRALFSFGRLNERLPPRFGYYVGYLVAREAGRTRSLQQLAHLSRDEARPVIEAALSRLATCE